MNAETRPQSFLHAPEASPMAQEWALSFFVVMDSANLWQHGKENECIALFILVCCCSILWSSICKDYNQARVSSLPCVLKSFTSRVKQTVGAEASIETHGMGSLSVFHLHVEVGIETRGMGSPPVFRPQYHAPFVFRGRHQSIDSDADLLGYSEMRLMLMLTQSTSRFEPRRPCPPPQTTKKKVDDIINNTTPFEGKIN